VGGVLVAVGISLALLTSFQIADAAVPYGLSDAESLEIHEGDLTVRLEGQVVEDLEIRGTLWIAANNVTVRNVWVYAEAPWTVYVERGSATLENVEIGHPDVIGERGIGGNNVTARLLDIHHVEDGIKLGNDSSYEQVYVHDLDSLSSDPHADAIQADGGSSGVRIVDSILDSTGPLGTGNASVFLKSDLGPIDDVLVVGNQLNGGAYTVFVQDGGNGQPAGVTFTDNTLGPDFAFGLTDIDGPVEWSGNTFGPTGEEVQSDGTLTATDSAPEPSGTNPSVTSSLAPSTTVLADPIDGAAREPPSPPPDSDDGPSITLWAAGLLAAFVLGVLFSSVWSTRRRNRGDRTG
jgi:hypothetical protein